MQYDRTRTDIDAQSAAQKGKLIPSRKDDGTVDIDGDGVPRRADDERVYRCRGRYPLSA